MTSVSGEDNAIVADTSSIAKQREQETSMTTLMSVNQTQSTTSTTSTTSTASTPTPPTVLPTRIPHPAVAEVPFQRSASMRVRGTKAQPFPINNSYLVSGVHNNFGPAGGFSSRSKLALSSTFASRPSVFKLTRNRSFSNLGHKTSETQSSESREEVHALCSATQHLGLAELKDLQTAVEPDVEENMAAKSRNMSLNLNGDCNSKEVATGNGNAVKTPKTPKTPLRSGTPGSSIPHSCVRQAHCGKHQATTPTTKLSTVPETRISPKTPPVTPDSPSTYLDDDLDSMYSFATTTSGRSTMSCEHPYVARNGTTFSGRKMKYVVHCSNYAGQVGADYLTPTQRAQRQIRRLKELLCIARQDLEQKDTEILRLTREVVELRLFKASLSSPEERSASSDAVTVREAELKTSQDVSPIVDMVDEVNAKCSPRHLVRQQHQQQQQQQLQMSAEMQSSYADSGHFEDLTTSSVHSKDSQTQHDADACASATPDAADGGETGANSLENYELQRQELIRMYEQRIEELIRTQDSAASDLKRSHNDKVEALLQKLAECNTRYADIVPDYEHAKERIRELEKQLEDLQRRLVEHEEKQNKMYLHMYQQGQEAERLTRADQALELAHRQPDSKVSITELLHQLQSTQDELENIRTIYRRLLEAQKNRTHVDPEVTLQFLKSAVYYFLTDKENSQGHLQAIESILEFTEAEKLKISQARSPK
ncbi:uncharacterized protein LOC115631051 isoform X2 [Scaptodrosophila lebanonensis]|uniref:Uncharacterized protein LOC115631051 isoform X2 n=1 Tax=Drosophila lebanonensis TaxID=7225 RepID=A0A6J2U5A0_DROLE|nr:uncharacterized protein LOC115631051 isoform X2 [Scaptodrosophila lebanonensis]